MQRIYRHVDSVFAASFVIIILVIGTMFLLMYLGINPHVIFLPILIILFLAMVISGILPTVLRAGEWLAMGMVSLYRYIRKTRTALA